MTRLLALLLPFLMLAGCSAAPKPVFERLSFDYLTKIKINVGTVDIDENWVPRGSLRQIGFLAPTRPVVALRTMAAERLVPGGTTGRALFVIDDASLVLTRGRYEASFAVHLDLRDDMDKTIATATAALRGSRKATDDTDEDAVRIDLDALVRKMMDDMNVEFEFQVRSALKAYLQNTSPDAPTPAAVDAQDLTTPTLTPPTVTPPLKP